MTHWRSFVNIRVVDSVPGNIYVQAFSTSSDLSPSAAVQSCPVGLFYYIKKSLHSDLSVFPNSSLTGSFPILSFYWINAIQLIAGSLKLSPVLIILFLSFLTYILNTLSTCYTVRNHQALVYQLICCLVGAVVTDIIEALCRNLRS